jgi:hypothetical protein
MGFSVSGSRKAFIPSSAVPNIGIIRSNSSSASNKISFLGASVVCSGAMAGRKVAGSIVRG